MKAMLFCQISENLPECVWSTLEKARSLFDGKIYIIVPQREMSYKKFSDLDIEVINVNKIKSDLIDEYTKKTFLISTQPDWNGFWDTACKRFVYMEWFMRQYGVDQLIHVENDVLIYQDINSMFKLFKDFYWDKIVFTPGENYRLNCGFVYCGSHAAMYEFCKSLIRYFTNGIEWWNEAYPTEAIVHETLFTYQFQQERPELVGLFPALPEDFYSEELGFLIDPDSWGRWVDGVRWDPGTPYAARKFYIGEKILDKVYDVEFENHVPYCVDLKTGKRTKIATLHFNSKRTWKWT